MFSQLVGNYFVQKGILSKEIVEEILKEQNEARVKLGIIAVTEKMLTEQQAEEINHLQTQMDMRFGDIAVDKGYLTEEEVKLLLKKQGNTYMKFIQLVLEKTDVSLDIIEKNVEAFQKERGFSTKEMNALKQDDIDAIVPVFAFSAKPYITEIVGLVLRNITRFVSTNYYIEHMHHVTQFKYKFIAGQKVTGDHNIYLAFATDDQPDGICLLASRFARENITQIGDDVADAVGEFANTNNGIFASELSKKNVLIDMEPPFAYMDQEVEGNGYIIDLFIEGKKVSLYIAVDEDISMGKEAYIYEHRHEVETVVRDDHKGTVVIVDDSRMIRKMLRGILEEEGYAVIAEAQNGVEAVAAYKQHKPDIITLDITMPQMDGVEALKEIIDYDKNANVIMITAAGQQQKVIQALKIGASKFVMKPFRKEDVMKGFEA